MKILTIEEFKALEEREEVVGMDDLGVSGNDASLRWFEVKYENGDTEDVYIYEEELEKY